MKRNDISSLQPLAYGGVCKTQWHHCMFSLQWCCHFCKSQEGRPSTQMLLLLLLLLLLLHDDEMMAARRRQQPKKKALVVVIYVYSLMSLGISEKFTYFISNMKTAVFIWFLKVPKKIEKMKVVKNVEKPPSIV